MRITFLGGGTDFPSVFNLQQGAAIYATINKFVYVSTLKQPQFVQDKFKFTYRRTESVSSIEELKHPVARETLKLFRWEEPLNISTMASLPGDSGLGSSSAFTSCLIHNLLTRRRVEIKRDELAKLAIMIEREILREAGGWQDQIATVFGGLRIIHFADNDFEVSKNYATHELSEYIADRSILVRVSNERNGLEVSKKNEYSLKQADQIYKLKAMTSETNELWKCFQEASTISNKFEVLQKSIQLAWNYKKDWGSHIITPNVEQTISKLSEIGVSHYKLIGAGGGGFILVMENHNKIEDVKERFSLDELVSFRISDTGTNTKVYE